MLKKEMWVVSLELLLRLLDNNILPINRIIAQIILNSIYVEIEWIQLRQLFNLAETFENFNKSSIRFFQFFR